MSRFEALLRKYKERSECDPPEFAASNVFARLRLASGDSVQALLARPQIRSAALAAGLVMGLIAATAPPIMANAAEPMPELTVFAPDMEHPPLIWLDPAQ